MEVLTLIIGVLLGAILVVIGQLSISTGLLGRRNQQPPKQVQRPTTP
jgi:hypothetical protein